jgi:hypothetical protein
MADQVLLNMVAELFAPLCLGGKAGCLIQNTLLMTLHFVKLCFKMEQ